MDDFCIQEYEKFLEANGVDTACFMGYGYRFEDVKVGAEFYFSYLYYCRSADRRRASPVELLKQCLAVRKLHYPDVEFTDKYILLQKYKYFDCYLVDTKNKTTIKTKQRRGYVRIKNTRTNKVTLLSEDDIDMFSLFCFVTW